MGWELSGRWGEDVWGQRTSLFHQEPRTLLALLLRAISFTCGPCWRIVSLSFCCEPKSPSLLQEPVPVPRASSRVHSVSHTCSSLHCWMVVSACQDTIVSSGQSGHEHERKAAGKTAEVYQERKWMMASTTQIITGCLKYQLKGKQVGQASGSTWANYTLLRACWAHHAPSLSKHWPLVWWEKPSVSGCSLKGIRDIQPTSPQELSGTKWGLPRRELRDCVWATGACQTGLATRP